MKWTMQPFQGDGMAWNALLKSLPMPHFLQTWEWAQVKAAWGWQPERLVWLDEEGRAAAAALVLRRALPIGGLAARMALCYAPKGPNLDWGNLPLRRRVLADLQDWARRRGAVFLKIDPDVPLGTGEPGSEDAREDRLGAEVTAALQAGGWRFSADQIQFRNTVLVDLTADEETILARMKQKTRYNIRLAARKGVSVRTATPDDWPLLYRMYAETAARDGFLIRPEAYYRTVWQTFTAAEDPHAEALLAEVAGEPVAGLWLFTFGERSYYFYGMSRPLHREKMPTYLLQWEAMRRAKARGCTVYDLWGAPDVFDESDRMWGVYRFKSGFGGTVLRTLGAWDYAPRPWLYRLYTEAVPRLLKLARRRR